MESRRKARRPIVRKVQIVTTNDTRAPVECTLQDLSESGARLNGTYFNKLPTEFYLRMSDELVRWCRVVWCNKTEAGVRFIKNPPPAASN